MLVYGKADFLSNEIITSKNGKTFNLVRWLTEDGKVITAITSELNAAQGLNKYKPYDVTFDYVENGNYKSLNYVTAKPAVIVAPKG